MNKVLGTLAFGILLYAILRKNTTTIKQMVSVSQQNKRDAVVTATTSNIQANAIPSIGFASERFKSGWNLYNGPNYMSSFN